MNTSLLQPALQRIINAVDSLPGRKGQHVPKSVLDAVEEGRKAMVDPDCYTFNYTLRIDALSSSSTVCKVVTDMLNEAVAKLSQAAIDLSLSELMLEQGFTFYLKELPENAAELLQSMEMNRKIYAEARMGRVTFLPPSKQRITLRGGPLAGCWYLHKPLPLKDVHPRMVLYEKLILPDGSEQWLAYSLPDSHGICYYRE